MPAIVDINRFAGLFADSFRAFRQGKIWLILVFYFLLDWLLLHAHVDFHSPLFYGVISSWISLLDSLLGNDGAQAFTHYPTHYYYLANYFGSAKLAVALVLEGLVLGAVARIFSESFSPRTDSPSSRRSLSASWPHLIMAWMVINVLTFAASYFMPILLAPYLDGPRRILAFRVFVLPATYTVILALFYFTIPSVAVFGENVIPAVRRSLGLFFRNPLTCLLLAGLILAFPIFFALLSQYSSQVIAKFRPEIVYWILWGGLVAEMTANFFFMGTAVRFLSQREA